MIDAKKFNHEIVRPTLAEFDAEFSDLRRAFLAVAVVDALAAQIFEQSNEQRINPFDLLGWHEKGHPQKPSDLSFRERIAEDCTAFRIIRDVAKANKHAVLTRGNPEIKRSDQIVSKPTAYGLGRFGEGRYGGVDQVMVQYDDGKEIYLESQLRDAHATLLGLIEKLENLTPPATM